MYAKISPPVFNQNLYVNNSTPQNTPAATLSAPTANILEFSLEKEAGNKKASLGFRGLFCLVARAKKEVKDPLEEVINGVISVLTRKNGDEVDFEALTNIAVALNNYTGKRIKQERPDLIDKVKKVIIDEGIPEDDGMRIMFEKYLKKPA